MKWEQLSPEYRVLLHCSRNHLGDERVREVATILEGPLDWGKLMELASWHRLSALLFHNLTRDELRSSVPPWAIQELEGIYFDNIARNLRFQAELNRVLSTLDTKGITAIVLKGSALLEPVYRDIGLRPMGDLDILVNDANLAPADGLVRGLGYSPDANEEIQQKTMDEHRHFPALFSPDGIVTVEIHRHIVRTDSPLHFNIFDLRGRARETTIAGAHGLVLAPEDLITHLCIHFFLDRRYSSRVALGQLCDISEAIQHYESVLDWDLFCQEAHRNSHSGPLHSALWATKTLLGTSPPESVLTSLEPQVFDPAMAELFNKNRVLGTTPWLAHEVLDPRSGYTPTNWVKGSLRRIFPNSADLATKYGKSSSGSSVLLYVRRTLQVAWLSGRSLLQPRRMRQDLQLDRWLHSLYETGGSDKQTRV